jgi:hypothetical protein
MYDFDYIDIHLCVSWATGHGSVKPWNTYLCSNCRRGDPRIFNLTVPRDTYESTKKRIEEEYQASRATQEPRVE